MCFNFPSCEYLHMKYIGVLYFTFHSIAYIPTCYLVLYPPKHDSNVGLALRMPTRFDRDNTNLFKISFCWVWKPYVEMVIAHASRFEGKESMKYYYMHSPSTCSFAALDNVFQAFPVSLISHRYSPSSSRVTFTICKLACPTIWTRPMYLAGICRDRTGVLYFSYWLAVKNILSNVDTLGEMCFEVPHFISTSVPLTEYFHRNFTVSLTTTWVSLGHVRKSSSNESPLHTIKQTIKTV